MDARRRALLLLVTFAGLLGFHVWLLARMVATRNVLLASLLVVAIGLFAWRMARYGSLYRGSAQAGRPMDRAAELRRIRTMVPVLAALLVLHAWLITQTLAADEIAFTALLVVAVGVFSARLALYAWRWAALRSP